jgi:hypothetical protein
LGRTSDRPRLNEIAGKSDLLPMENQSAGEGCGTTAVSARGPPQRESALEKASWVSFAAAWNSFHSDFASAIIQQVRTRAHSPLFLARGKAKVTLSTNRTEGRVSAGKPDPPGSPVFLRPGLNFDRQLPEQFTTPPQLARAMTIGKQAAMADAHKTLGQHVQQEPADEFAGRQCHLPYACILRVVLIGEGDLILFQPDEARSGEGDSVGLRSSSPPVRRRQRVAGS